MSEPPQPISKTVVREIEALTNPDVASVFELLQKAGVSQRRIASLTGQSQSEISEIRAGRKVKNIDVLARIADGLKVSRRVFGLAAAAEPSYPATSQVNVEDRSTPKQPGPMTVHLVAPSDVSHMDSDVHSERDDKPSRDEPLPHLCDRPVHGSEADPSLPMQCRHYDSHAVRAHREPVLSSREVRLSPHLSPGDMYTWTGREVKLLREARRLSVREFAAHLGVSDRMVSKWEGGGANIRPRPVNQAALDTSLRRADPGAQELFYAALAYASTPTTNLKITASPHESTNTCWVVHVPVWADSREEVVALAERISTALGWLPGVEIERLEMRRESMSQPRQP